MTLAELVPLVLQFSILAIAFATGLSAQAADLLSVVRRPARLATSLLAMVVIMPLVAVALVRALSLPQAVGVMLVALALAPVPPILPAKQVKAGGDTSYAVGLLVAAGLVSVVWIPVSLELIERVFGVPLEAHPAVIAGSIARTVLAPIVAGVVVARLAPGLATKLAGRVSLLGGLLLLVGLLLVAARFWHAMGDLVGGGALLAMAAFVVIGLAAGHLLGGPAPVDRTVLAMASATRHPGVALAIAQLNYPHEPALLPAALMFLLTNMVLSAPYVAWRRKVGAAQDLSMTARPT